MSPSGPPNAPRQRAAWLPQTSNDSLRREAAPAIAGAATDAGVARFIQESITFPYVDGGDQWIDEQFQREYNATNDSVAAAEAAANAFADAGGVGIALRFALFMAPDSAHTTNFHSAAQRGQFAVIGDLDGYVSFIHMDDAAPAVIAALEVPAGTYNVAEPDPVKRSAHCEALASAVGRSRLEQVATPSAAGATSLARSHRISSRSLSEVSSWAPSVHCVDQWKEL